MGKPRVTHRTPSVVSLEKRRRRLASACSGSSCIEWLQMTLVAAETSHFVGSTIWKTQEDCYTKGVQTASQCRREEPRGFEARAHRGMR